MPIFWSALFLAGCSTSPPPEVIGQEGQRCPVDNITFSALSAALTADADQSGSGQLTLSGTMHCGEAPMAWSDVYLHWETQDALFKTTTGEGGTFSLTRTVSVSTLTGTHAGVGVKSAQAVLSDPMAAPEWVRFPVTTP